MTAQELLAALRAGAELPPCPVLVVTGSDPVDGPRLLRSGAQGHIGKAWTRPKSLTRAVEDAIERFALQRDRQRAQVVLALERERLALALTAGQFRAVAGVVPGPGASGGPAPALAGRHPGRPVGPGAQRGRPHPAVGWRTALDRPLQPDAAGHRRPAPS